MADEHGHDEGGGEAIGMKEAGERITVIIIILVIISFILLRLTGTVDLSLLWQNFKDAFLLFLHENAFGRFLLWCVFALKFAGTYIALLFLIIDVYLYRELIKLHEADHHMYAPPHEHGGEHHGHAVHEESPEKQKWNRIQAHLSSDNASDWRLSILEADIMLEEMLEKNGFLGDTLGDKLKNANKNDFAKLQVAWEAHLVRNLIAHEGSDFLISKREATRVIGLYKEAFDEFSYIK